MTNPSTTAADARRQRALEDLQDSETAADRQHARAVERNEALLKQAPKNATVSRFTHYVSKANGLVYPAMRSPAGYEDQHPTEWSPATAEQISAFQTHLDDPDARRANAETHAAALTRASALRGAGIGVPGVLDDGRIFGVRPEDYVRANTGFGTNTQTAGLPTDPRETVAAAGLPGLSGNTISLPELSAKAAPDAVLKPVDEQADDIRQQDTVALGDQAHMATSAVAVAQDEAVRGLQTATDLTGATPATKAVSKPKTAK